MTDYTLDELTQKALTVGILTPVQLQELWQRIGTRRIEPDVFLHEVLKQGFLTNYQVERLASKEMNGFFFGEYKALYLIGAGSFARVFRASHRDTGKIVALKILRTRFNENPEIIEHFKREAEFGIELRHPNIVPIFEVYSKRGLNFMVMDFIEGQTLREFINVRKKLDAKVATRIALDIAQGIDYAARRGVQHRDLKLSNVLLSSGGKAMLADFGLAAIDESLFSALPELKNQRAIDYAALERFTGVKRDDIRSDIYFLGCIYYHIVSGVPPLVETRDRAKRLDKSRYFGVKPVLDVDPSVPAAVAFIVNKAMSLDPEKRYQTAAEMCADLIACTKRLNDGTANDGVDALSLGDRLAKQQALKAKSQSNERQFTVMIVETDQNLQNVFRDALKKSNYKTLLITSPERVMSRFFDDGKAADLVLFNAQSLGEEAVDGFNQMLEDRDTKLVPAILLMDPRHEALLAKAKRDKHRIVLAMPITMRVLRESIARLIAHRYGIPYTPPPIPEPKAAVPEPEPVIDVPADVESDNAWDAAAQDYYSELQDQDPQDDQEVEFDDDEAADDDDEYAEYSEDEYPADEYEEEAEEEEYYDEDGEYAEYEEDEYAEHDEDGEYAEYEEEDEYAEYDEDGEYEEELEDQYEDEYYEEELEHVAEPEPPVVEPEFPITVPENNTISPKRSNYIASSTSIQALWTPNPKLNLDSNWSFGVSFSNITSDVSWALNSGFGFDSDILPEEYEEQQLVVPEPVPEYIPEPEPEYIPEPEPEYIPEPEPEYIPEPEPIVAPPPRRPIPQQHLRRSSIQPPPPQKPVPGPPQRTQRPVSGQPPQRPVSGPPKQLPPKLPVRPGMRPKSSVDTETEPETGKHPRRI